MKNMDPYISKGPGVAREKTAIAGFGFSSMLDCGGNLAMGSTQIQKWSPRWGMGAVTLDQPKISFPRVGYCVETENVGRVHASPGQAFTLNPITNFQTDPTTRCNGQIDWITLDQEYFADNFLDGDSNGKLEKQDRPFSLACVTMGPKLFLNQRKLFDYVRNEENVDQLYVEERVLGIVREIMSSMSDNLEKSNFRKPCTKREHRNVVYATQEYIETNLGSSLKLPEIGKAVGVSAAHLTVIFKRETGVSIHAYVTARRMQKACDLLPDYGGRLSHLAYKLGFSSGNHFCNVFRSYFGESPSRLLPFEHK